MDGYVHTHIHTYIHTYKIICKSISVCYTLNIKIKSEIELRGRAMGRRSVLQGRPIELLHVSASAPRLVNKSFGMWDDAYKRALAANRKE